MEGEAHRSIVAHVDCEEVWERVGNFNSMGEWMGQTCKVCLLENAPCGPNDIGAIRRVVLGDKETMVRERLKAHFSSAKKKYYTYEMVNPAEYDRYRALFDFEFENITVTLSLAPVTHHKKTYIDLYATYKVTSEAHHATVKQRLEDYFQTQLDAIIAATSQHDADMSFPDVLTTFYGASCFEKYHGDLEALVALWRDQVGANRAAHHRIAELEAELEAARKTVDALAAHPRAPTHPAHLNGSPRSRLSSPLELEGAPEADVPEGDEFKKLLGSPMYSEGKAEEAAATLRKSFCYPGETPADDALPGMDDDMLLGEPTNSVGGGSPDAGYAPHPPAGAPTPAALRPKQPQAPDVPAALRPKQAPAPQHATPDVPAALKPKKSATATVAAPPHAGVFLPEGDAPVDGVPGGLAQGVGVDPLADEVDVEEAPDAARAAPAVDDESAARPMRADAQVELLYPRIKGLSMQQREIANLFNRLDERHRGYLTPQAVAKFYLEIDIFEDEQSVQRVLKRYIEDGKVSFNSFHSLVLNTIAQ